MSSFVFFMVLGAAALHAGWNALLRAGGDRVQTMMVLSAVQGLLGLGVVLTSPVQAAALWPWLLASGVIHSAYKCLLAFAYEHGELSGVYPLARGAAPLVTLAAGSLLLGEPVSGRAVLGVLLLALGILSLARGLWTGGHGRRMVPFALGAALATAGYTLVDGMGARLSGDAGLFVGWLFLIDGVIFAAAMLGLRGRGALPRGAGVWLRGGLGAMASYLSYAIAVWAMTQAPIALVGALRESSILFATLIGWALLGERMTAARALSVLLIAGGVVLMRL